MTSILFVDSYPQAIAGQQETLTALLEACPRYGVVPTVGMPGPGIFADRLRARGMRVEVIQQPARIDIYGGAVYRYGPRARVQMAGQLLLYVWRIRHWMKREKFDAIYVNDMRALLTFGLAARTLRLPVLLWDKLDKPHGLYDALQLPLVRRNLMITRAVAAKYPSWQRQLWRRKMAVVHDGIDASRFQPADRGEARKRLGLAPGAVVLAIAGTICRRKGHDRLLAAFAAARAESPVALTLLVIGASEPESESFASALKARDDGGVHWLGRRDDIAAILPALDFLVSPSRHEGMGRVNVEAMACALPVIGAEATGIAEVVIDGDTGYLVDAADAQALKSAIIRLAYDPDLRARMGQSGRERALQGFDARRQVGCVLAELCSLAST